MVYVDITNDLPNLLFCYLCNGQMLKTVFSRSENSVNLYDGLFLFSLATKRLPHTLHRCWTLVMC